MGEQENRDNTAKDNNDIRKESTFEEWILKPQKENMIIAVEDIDKKQEKLIRNFYDGRRKKRSFTKIQAVVMEKKESECEIIVNRERTESESSNHSNPDETFVSRPDSRLSNCSETE